jgi:hypothetical protein
MEDYKWEKLITDSLNNAGNKINPPRELLFRIIEAASVPAISKSEKLFNSIFNWKLLTAAGTAMILLVTFFSFPANFKHVHQSAKVADQNINQPLTADDVDAAANAILASASDEDSELSSADSDESLSKDDSQAIKTIIQNYDQEQF